MARKLRYTEEERKISNRYSSIKQRAEELEWSREKFIEWYKKQDKKCCYCGSTEKELKIFYDSDKSKRKRTRGMTLEIDRKADKEYSEENCVLSCYWCNTNVISKKKLSAF